MPSAAGQPVSEALLRARAERDPSGRQAAVGDFLTAHCRKAGSPPGGKRPKRWTVAERGWPLGHRD